MSEAIDHFTEPRGEFTLVVEGADDTTTPVPREDAREMMARLKGQGASAARRYLGHYGRNRTFTARTLCDMANAALTPRSDSPHPQTFTTVFTRLSSVERDISKRLAQVRHFSPMSAPRRTTSQSVPAARVPFPEPDDPAEFVLPYHDLPWSSSIPFIESLKSSAARPAASANVSASDEA